MAEAGPAWNMLLGDRRDLWDANASHVDVTIVSGTLEDSQKPISRTDQGLLARLNVEFALVTQGAGKHVLCRGWCHGADMEQRAKITHG
jgi:hypothetical protein